MLTKTNLSVRCLVPTPRVTLISGIGGVARGRKNVVKTKEHLDNMQVWIR